jgi:Protein of unknown function (DUF3667)
MFFSSLKLLLFKPGILTRKYIEGKRAGYLNPIKMYVFTSAVFFIIFFSFLNPAKSIHDDSAEAKIAALTKTKKDLVYVRDSSLKPVNQEAISRAIAETDSSIIVMQRKDMEESREAEKLKQTIGKVGDSVLVISPSIRISIDSGRLRSKSTGGNGFLESVSFSNLGAYQAYQYQLPDSQKDKMLKKAILYRTIKIREKSAGDKLEPVRTLVDKFFHAFPQLLFISLPLFAFFLWILYIRKKKYYYVDHIIFTLHLFCASFIFILFIALFRQLEDLSGWGIWGYLNPMIFLLIIYYQYKALRNFYSQGRGKTILKLILLNIMAYIGMVLLLAGLLIFTAFQI